MGPALFLIECLRWNKEIERGLEVELRLVWERLPSIPARGSESTGWVIETIKDCGK